jgi:glycine cleavage system P protein (glycine dehydrogenase) subunit 1
MAYIPHTAEQKQEMLRALGLERIEQLFEEQIPTALLLDRPLDIPPGMSELELRRHFQALAGQNRSAGEQLCFLGAGIYDHYVPSVVPTLILRGEFHTAYTPYQPEMSQGTLQSIFEFQTMVSALTGMDVANASMYDGATALAEAVILACGVTNRDEAVLLGVHPAWVQVTRTYVEGLGIRVIDAPPPASGYPASGIADREWLERTVSTETAVLAVQQPNFFGSVEDLQALGETAHHAGALLVVGANPIALGLLEPPGALGADVVVGEGQPLGLGMNFGGPLVGFFAAKKQYLRQMPGRLVSQTTDRNGRTGYVLTLQTREQHIRRERATSNICTNQGLMMLAATVYLSVMGKQGLREVAEQCLHKAHYAAERLASVPGYRVKFQAPFFHEFVLQCPRSGQEVATRLAEQGILAGYPLGRHYPDLEDCLLVAVTEKRTREEIDRFAAALSGFSRKCTRMDANRRRSMEPRMNADEHR